MTPNRFPGPCVEWTPKYQLSMLKSPTFRWAHMLNCTLNGIDILGIPKVLGTIFAGSPGNGRHTTADALAGSLKARDIRCCLRVSGATLDTADVADACTAVDGAMGYLRQHGKVCLLLDCPEHSRHSLAVQEYLYRRILTHGYDLFVIIITDAVSNIIPNLQQVLTVCQFRKPDADVRQKWLRSMLDGRVIIKIDGMNHIALARETEGFTWRQMTDLRTMLRRAIALKYVQDPLKYNPDNTPGLEQQLWKEGKVHLDKEDVTPLLACIREQAAVPAAGMTLPVQLAAAAPAAAAAPECEPLSEEESAAALERHRNPEKLTFQQLIAVDPF